MQQFMATVQRVVASDSSLLILGETGVGKERLARAIHAEGPRAQRPVRRGQLRRAARDPARERAVRPRERGVHRRDPGPPRATSSWPTAARSSSTRSARCPLHLQVKLLRVLQEREIQRVGGEKPDSTVDVRVIAATNRDLEERGRATGASARTSTTGWRWSTLTLPAAARAPRGHPAAGRELPRALRARGWDVHVRRDRPERARGAGAPTTGRATCAS